jgi:hypothetical protein
MFTATMNVSCIRLIFLDSAGMVFPSFVIDGPGAGLADQ